MAIREQYSSTDGSKKFFDYTPFGAEINSNYNDPNGWISSERDFESRYMNLQARLYDPTIGRFLSVDPLAEIQIGITPYHYCGNDPINASDPSGLYAGENTGSGGLGGYSGIMDLGIMSKSNNFSDDIPSFWNWRNYAYVGADNSEAITSTDIMFCYWFYWQDNSGGSQTGVSSSSEKIEKKDCEDIGVTKRYKTKEAAAHAWAVQYNGKSIKEKLEYASWIIKVTESDGSERFSYTQARPGWYNYSNAGPKPIEDGVSVVAHIHSHGNYDKDFINDEPGSIDKINQANHYKCDMFVVTPKGQLWVLRWEWFKRNGIRMRRSTPYRFDYDDIPYDPNHPYYKNK